MAETKILDIESVLRTFESSHWQELEISFNGAELFLSKTPGATPSWSSSRPKNLQNESSTTLQPQTKDPVIDTPKCNASTTATNVEDLDHGLHVIKAPSLGTFYRSAKPGEASFVEIGQKLESDTELCLIEVMKLFTTLRSDVAGVIKEILAEDGEMVEYGQPLFLIEKEG